MTDTAETLRDSRLRRRRRTRTSFAIAAAMLLVTIVADRSGLFGYAGNDWQRFDRRPARVSGIIDGNRVRASVDGRQFFDVQLLGIDAPAAAIDLQADHRPDHWAAEAKQYLTSRLADRVVTLRLDGTQSRDAQGHLLAYVYITDADLLNADMVRDGQAYADRRLKHTFASAIEQLERDARLKKRGLWKDLNDDDMPAWRREWLASMRKRRRTGTT